MPLLWQSQFRGVNPLQEMRGASQFRDRIIFKLYNLIPIVTNRIATKAEREYIGA